MDAIDKLQLLFGKQYDKEMLKAANEASLELVTQFMMILELEFNDHKKLKCIQSKLKETKKEFRKIEIKLECYHELLAEHNNSMLKKLATNQYFNIPEDFELSVSFNEKEIKLPVSGDEDDELEEVCEVEEVYVGGHWECVENHTGNAFKKILITALFIFELRKLEKEIKLRMLPEPKTALAEKTSSEKKYDGAIIIELEEETSGSATENHIPSKYLQIFKEGGAELFCYLQTEYTIDDISPVAKYSYIHHFLAYEQLITARSQLKYIEFIKDSYGLNMSKILPENGKFNDDIHRMLSRLKSDFERKSKFEQKLN